MAEKDLELEKTVYKKFLVKCSHCGHEFLPWRAFGITSSETDWKSGFYCPSCHKLHIQSNN
jgi:DNA-directed RNA polymerase subunit RPC12/RpoP